MNQNLKKLNNLILKNQFNNYKLQLLIFRFYYFKVKISFFFKMVT